MACHGGGGHVEYSLAIMVQSEPKVGGWSSRDSSEFGAYIL